MTTDADVRRYFDVMVDRADLPEDRARDWVVVRSMGYLLWGLRHGLTTDPVRCQRLLHIFA
jgi:streptomycin 6-kinase